MTHHHGLPAVRMRRCSGPGWHRFCHLQNMRKEPGQQEKFGSCAAAGTWRPLRKAKLLCRTAASRLTSASCLSDDTNVALANQGTICCNSRHNAAGVQPSRDECRCVADGAEACAGSCVARLQTGCQGLGRLCLKARTAPNRCDRFKQYRLSRRLWADCAASGRDGPKCASRVSGCPLARAYQGGDTHLRPSGRYQRRWPGPGWHCCLQGATVVMRTTHSYEGCCVAASGSAVSAWQRQQAAPALTLCGELGKVTTCAQASKGTGWSRKCR